jgi:RNA polymerase sigma factor (sigma-70 family)
MRTEPSGVEGAAWSATMCVMTVAQEASGAGLSPTVSRAAEQLFHEHSGWLYGYCLRLLRSPEEAEDAVQATYLNACRSLGNGTRPRAGSAWLLHIARNVCFTRLRSARRRQGVERVGDIAVLEETVAAPDRSYDSLVGLTDALLALPERQREAILLREWQGLSHGEIAERLGISHSAAETLIFRARRSLADALENPGKRRRLKALHVLDLGFLLGPLKGLLAGGAGAKAATAVTVAALTTVTVVATDPPGIPGLGHDPARAPAAQSAPRVAAASTPVSIVRSTIVAAPHRPAADGPASQRPDHGRAHGRPKDKAAKGKGGDGPRGNANGGGNGNGPGSSNGKALGKAKEKGSLPPTANGQGTPAGGSQAPGQAKKSEPAAPAPTGPPEHAKAIGFGKDKPAKGSSN